MTIEPVGSAAAAASRPPAEPVKLGLALSGGGFRAALFHLGVFIRLAELDLLRHLSVISSVSGGSVIAAHYMLRLKVALERADAAGLSRDDYVALVARMRAELERAIATQPRSRLWSDPVAWLRMLFLGFTRSRLGLSDEMAGMYQRELYASGTREIRGATPADVARGMPLCRMKIQLPELARHADIERFNSTHPIDRVPKLVLNAATLNTGCKFTLTFSEVGDERLGHVRCDEWWQLLGYKLLVGAYLPRPDLARAAADASAQAVAQRRKAAGAAGSAHVPAHDALETRALTHEHLAWWAAAKAEAAARQAQTGLSGAGEDWSSRLASQGLSPGAFRSVAVRTLFASWPRTRHLLECPLGALRVAKVAAWFVRDGGGWSAVAGGAAARRGGFTHAEHAERFWSAIGDVDAGLLASARPRGTLASAEAGEADWMELVVDLYLIRMGVHLHGGPVNEITLPMAVQASANFPPVFSPLRLPGLYDASLVNPLQLSDGGLNDNNGIETLFEERCTHIIASEAGPGPSVSRTVGGNRLGMLAKIMLNQLVIVRRLQLRTLADDVRVKRALNVLPGLAGPAGDPALDALRDRHPLQAVAFFQIDSNPSDGLPPTDAVPPLAPHPLAKDIERLRTDLDAFSGPERDALLHQGYQYCDSFVRRYLHPDLVARRLVPAGVVPPVSPARLPEGAWEWAQARRVIRAGGGMMFRWWGIAGDWRLPIAMLLFALVLLWGGGLFWYGRHVPVWLADWLGPTRLAPPARMFVSIVVTTLAAAWATLTFLGRMVLLDGWFTARASRI